MAASTLFQKLWDRHVVVPETPDTPAVLYIDLHLVHEVTSPQAFRELRERGLRVRRPDRTRATMDHSTPTEPRPSTGRLPVLDEAAGAQLEELRRSCREFGIELLDVDDDRRGIVHVIGPELGLTRPGMTIVCGDSHTSTHGAFGALAFGIGTTEVGHVLATQCVLQRRPRTMSVQVSGRLGHGATAKDLALWIIRTIGVSGGTGHAIEYRGPGVRALGMDGRMTLCNMSIEAGARAGMIGPDEVTAAYLRDEAARAGTAPTGGDAEDWKRLTTDDGAAFDREVTVDASGVPPMITYGTNPGMCVPIDGVVPEGSDDPNHRRALGYMALTPGEPMIGRRIDVVFIGSCTNSRLSDLRSAAEILRGRRVAPGVRTLVVPGSQAVKRRAEAEGLARAFVEAGAEWREPGCSMCIAMNPDRVPAGAYAVSTSNRNFEGRQGSGARTLLASPLTAAAAAVTGRITDPRDFLS